MNKKYIKPETIISQIEMDELMQLTTSDSYANPDLPVESKDREEWVMETDLWGNESWTRTK